MSGPGIRSTDSKKLFPAASVALAVYVDAVEAKEVNTASTGKSIVEIDMVLGIQAVVRWHASHESVVEICIELLPLAVVPLWQVAQVPGTTLLWPVVAGFQPVVRWQVSHEAVVAIWLEFLPFAVVPLWQVSQVPGTTLL